MTEDPARVMAWGLFCCENARLFRNSHLTPKGTTPTARPTRRWASTSTPRASDARTRTPAPSPPSSWQRGRPSSGRTTRSARKTSRDEPTRADQSRPICDNNNLRSCSQPRHLHGSPLTETCAGFLRLGGLFKGTHGRQPTAGEWIASQRHAPLAPQPRAAMLDMPRVRTPRPHRL